MFVVVVPPRFEADLLAGRGPELQVNIDATAMQQASIGAATSRTSSPTRSRASSGGRSAKRGVARLGRRPQGLQPQRRHVVVHQHRGHHQPDDDAHDDPDRRGADPRARARHDRAHARHAADRLRDRLAKVWANGLVVLVAVTASLFLVVRTILAVPIAGSPALFLSGVVLYLFFATALGIFLGTITRSMAQFALLIILIDHRAPVAVRREHARREPAALDAAAHALPPLAPLRRFSQAIIYRGAGLETVWPQFLAVGGIGLAFFVFSLRLFRQSIAVTK